MNIKSVVYGGLDGIITTFAIIAGSEGLHLSVEIILILGIANLLADGISMGIGDYLSTKSENEEHIIKRDQEQKNITQLPKSEKVAIVQKYRQSGMGIDDAIVLQNIISKYPTILHEAVVFTKHAISSEDENPFINALTTFISFLVFGVGPLIPYIFGFTFTVSIIITAVFLFGLGVAKAEITGSNKLKCGLETLAVGAIASGIAFLVGNYF